MRLSRCDSNGGAGSACVFVFEVYMWLCLVVGKVATDPLFSVPHQRRKESRKRKKQKIEMS